jgi:tetratricopeptide (TPR) repeat protein
VANRFRLPALRTAPRPLVAVEALLGGFTQGRLQGAVFLAAFAVFFFGGLHSVWTIVWVFLASLLAIFTFHLRPALYLRLGYRDLARQAAKALAEGFEGTPLAHVRGVDVAGYHLVAGDSAGALRALDGLDPEAMANDRMRDYFHLARARALMNLGELEEAGEALARVCTDAFELAAGVMRVRLAFYRGELTEARALLEEVEVDSPEEEAELKALHAFLELRLGGDRDAAVLLAGEALERDPANTEAEAALIHARVAAGDVDDDVVDYLTARLASRDPALGEPARAFVLYDMIRAHRRLDASVDVDALVRQLEELPMGAEYLGRLEEAA